MINKHVISKQCTFLFFFLLFFFREFFNVTSKKIV